MSTRQPTVSVATGCAGLTSLSSTTRASHSSCVPVTSPGSSSLSSPTTTSAIARRRLRPRSPTQLTCSGWPRRSIPAAPAPTSPTTRARNTPPQSATRRFPTSLWPIRTTSRCLATARPGYSISTTSSWCRVGPSSACVTALSAGITVTTRSECALTPSTSPRRLPDSHGPQRC